MDSSLLLCRAAYARSLHVASAFRYTAIKENENLKARIRAAGEISTATYRVAERHSAKSPARR